MSELPVIPGFRMVRLLGQGGMADVYEAVQEKLDRKVAVKVMIPELFRDESFSARFIREAQTAARLNHPNVLHIYDVGATPSCNYIVMECLLESLKAWLKRGALRPDAALHVMDRIGHALDYAHRKGIVHRDIKPDNIMFREDGTPVLTDFGIAKAMDSTTKLTRTGSSVGTPHYMSPEQISGLEIDGRADFYSLGIVFFEMLTGRVPYEATDPLAICMKHVHEPVPVLPLPLSCYQRLLEALLAKKPEKRLSSGEELQKWIAGLPNISGGPLAEKRGSGPQADAGEKDLGLPPNTLAYSTRDQAALSRKKPQHLLPWLAALIGILAVILLVPWGKLANDARDEKAQKPFAEALQGKSDPPPAGAGSRTERVEAEAGKADQKPAVQKARSPVTEPGDKAPRPREVSAERKAGEAAGKSQLPAVALRRIGLFELDPQLAQQYGLQLQRIHVAGIPDGVNAFGQVSLLLDIDEAGRAAIHSLDDRLLTVEPSGQHSLVQALIAKAVERAHFVPPRDLDGRAVILEKWRSSFKIVTLAGKMTLIRQ